MELPAGPLRQELSLLPGWGLNPDTLPRCLVLETSSPGGSVGQRWGRTAVLLDWAKPAEPGPAVDLEVVVLGGVQSPPGN